MWTEPNQNGRTHMPGITSISPPASMAGRSSQSIGTNSGLRPSDSARLWASSTSNPTSWRLRLKKLNGTLAGS